MKNQNLEKKKIVRSRKVLSSTENTSGEEARAKSSDSNKTVGKIKRVDTKKNEVVAIPIRHGGTRKIHGQVVRDLQALTLRIHQTAEAVYTSELFGRFTGVFPYERFSGIRIAFEGSRTKYDWGEHLSLINSNPFQFYFRTPQTSDSIEILGIGPKTSSQLWGSVVFEIQELCYSSRFGGSFQVRLIPIEDFGIELSSSGVYLDLNKWMMNLYIQPNKALYNSPMTASVNIDKYCYVEIDVLDSEAYELHDFALIPHPTVQEEQISGLIVSAAKDARSRLKNLALYTLGYVHYTHLDSFNSAGEKVSGLFISNRNCRFETAVKTPFVKILMKSNIYGTEQLEGIFSGSPEVTASFYVNLLGGPYHSIFYNYKDKYIGSGKTTGYVTMGYISLEELAQVRSVTAGIDCSESDWLSDEWYFSPPFEWDVGFELNSLIEQAEANQLGIIGDELWDVKDSRSDDSLSYLAQIRFELCKF